MDQYFLLHHTSLSPHRQENGIALALVFIGWLSSICWYQFNLDDGLLFVCFPDDGEEACLLYAKHEVSQPFSYLLYSPANHDFALKNKATNKSVRRLVATSCRPRFVIDRATRRVRALLADTTRAKKRKTPKNDERIYDYADFTGRVCSSSSFSFRRHFMSEDPALGFGQKRRA